MHKSLNATGKHNVIVFFFYLFTARDFETAVTVARAGDVFIRVNFQDGYQIPERVRLLMKYTNGRGTEPKNMMSERTFVNTSSISVMVPRSSVPHEQFRVQVALQVGDKVGQFVSDNKTHGKHVP